MDETSNRIHDLPSGDRPREKMERDGPAALSAEELLAIFFRTGLPGMSAIDIGRSLLRRHGGLGPLGRLGIGQLTEEPGLGPAKACQLMAAFELGARVAKENLSAEMLDSPERLYRFLAPITGHWSQEKLHVLVLNSRLRLITMAEISVGTANQTLAFPRDIIRPVLLNQATNFVVTHNHPSGDPSPSRSDDSLTQQLSDAAGLMRLNFMDHVIIGRSSGGEVPYYSFREHDRLQPGGR